MSTNWDVMREWEERMKKLKEDAADDGIEVSDAAISSAMDIFYALQGPGSVPYKDGNRLFQHGPDGAHEEANDDEWRLP